MKRPLEDRATKLTRDISRREAAMGTHMDELKVRGCAYSFHCECTCLHPRPPDLLQHAAAAAWGECAGWDGRQSGCAPSA